MNPMDYFGQMGHLQAQLAEAREKMKSLTADGEAGAGLVKVTVNGEFSVLSCSIDPSLMDPEKVHTLEVLVATAYNSAVNAMQERLKSEGSAMLSEVLHP